MVKWYKVIEDSKAYVESCLNRGSVVYKARKNVAALARMALQDEKVYTWVENGTLETTAVAEAGDYILAKIGKGKSPAVDTNGHINCWIVKPDTFNSKYTTTDKITSSEWTVVNAVGEIREFIRIDEDIEIKVSWGEMRIDAGGYLNITDLKDIYGIAEKEFNETHTLL